MHLGLNWGSVMHRGVFLPPSFTQKLRTIDAVLITLKPVTLPLRPLRCTSGAQSAPPLYLRDREGHRCPPAWAPLNIRGGVAAAAANAQDHCCAP